MARSQRSRAKSSSRKPSRRRLGRWVGWIVLAVALVALVALPVYRWWWRRDDAGPLQRGLALLDSEGCVGCHRGPDETLRWHADGTSSPSMAVVRDAILNGRPAAGTMLEPMPPFGSRLRIGEWQEAATAVGVLEGLLGVPEDPELAAGHDAAVQMGCFSCHGVLGAGGVANPGSLTRRVPGFYGPDFARVAAAPGGLDAVLRQGAQPRRSPIPGLPRPVLVMPAYGERLDSTELDLVVRYIQWLHDNPPKFSGS